MFCFNPFRWRKTKRSDGLSPLKSTMQHCYHGFIDHNGYIRSPANLMSNFIPHHQLTESSGENLVGGDMTMQIGVVFSQKRRLVDSVLSLCPLKDSFPIKTRQLISFLRISRFFFTCLMCSSVAPRHCSSRCRSSLMSPNVYDKVAKQE